MVLLCLSALVIFPIVACYASSPKVNIKNTNRFNTALHLKPCGDPIDTPGWPQMSPKN